MVILLAIILGFSPSFVWLYFFLKEDIHPEPKKIIFRVFATGALITLPAVALQMIFRQGLDFLRFEHYSLVSFAVLATGEEVLKFLAAYFSGRRSGFFDESIDAMIYMITAALGFAAAENIFVVLSGTKEIGADLGLIFGIITFRFVGATLLHALSSAIVGYHWARGLSKIGNWRLEIFKGLVLASLLHTVFNYLILKFSQELIYPTIFLIGIAFFIFWDFEKIKSTNVKISE